MRLLSLAVAACLVTSFAGPSIADESATTAQQKLQGRWEIVSGVNQGRPLSETEVEGTYVLVQANSIITYDSDDNALYQAVFTIDEETQPMTITMKAVAKKKTDGPAAGETTKDWSGDVISLGIVKIESPTKWKLCYALPGTAQPDKFESEAGSKVMCFTMEKRHSGAPGQTVANDE